MLISLSFFPDISVAVKCGMAKALETEGSDHPPKLITVEVAAAPISEKTLCNFVTKSSSCFFEVLSLPTKFLLVDPLEWEKRAMKFIRTTKVASVCEERGVTLMQNFNSILTQNDDQQFTLQLVEQHQKKYPHALKQTIAKNSRL